MYRRHYFSMYIPYNSQRGCFCTKSSMRLVRPPPGTQQHLVEGWRGTDHTTVFVFFSGSQPFSTRWQRVKLQQNISPSAPLTQMKAECLLLLMNAMIFSANPASPGQVWGLTIHTLVTLHFVLAVTGHKMTAAGMWNTTMLTTRRCLCYSLLLSPSVVLGKERKGENNTIVCILADDTYWCSSPFFSPPCLLG